MKRWTAITLAFLMLCADGEASDVEVQWADLRKAGPDRPVSRSDEDEITIFGFLVPVDRDGTLVHEFLLVPWVGACSHMAQPEPTQVIRVTPAVPYEADRSYEGVTISGKLKVGEELTQLFIMDGVVVIRSAYAMGGATVRASNKPSPPAPMRNPWRELQR